MTNERAQTELPSLKGCPFCGGEAKLVHDERGHQYPTWYVICPPCDLIRDQAFGCATKEEAIAAWNTRTPSPEIPVSATPSADVSSLEKVARAMHSEMLAMENEDGGEGCEFDETTPEQRAMLDRLARAAIAAYDTEAAIVLKRYREAITSFQRADTEFRRARNADEQPWLSNAGTRYQCAKWRLFRALKTGA